MNDAEPLFFEPNVSFDKTAAEVQLPEDANSWPMELMQEIFKQAPYLSDFDPHVVMDRVDAERGFGFGHVEIQNKTEAGPGVQPEQADAAGMKSARIPVIIKDRKLQPLDLLVTEDSQVIPLTEGRLRSAIFRPQAFDVTGKGPGDMSMVGQLYPPFRSGLGGMGGGTSMAKDASAKATAADFVNSLYKDPSKATAADRARQTAHAEKHPEMWRNETAESLRAPRAKHASLLAAIMPSVNESDYHAFFDKVANDRGLQAQLAVNTACAGALRTLASYEPVSAQKLASAAIDRLKPSVVQLRKEAEGYTLKTASHAFWLPEIQELDRGQAFRLLGPKVVLAADETGGVTLTVKNPKPPAAPEGEAPPQEDGAPAQEQPTEEATPQQNPEADKPALITQFGIYKVKNEEGTELIGYVFPNLLDLDGQSLPISLFTNGSHKAVQSDIVGMGVASGATLIEGLPQGAGAFYQTLPNGRAQAVIPMTLQASAESPDGAHTFQGETYDGRPVTIAIQPNIKEVTLVDGTLLVPDTFSWLPLDKAEDIGLAETPEEWDSEKTASAWFSSVALRCGGPNTFSVTGYPVEKLASDDKQFLSLDDTMFLLGGLGVDMDLAQKKLGEAAAWNRPVDVPVRRQITTAAEVGAQSKTAAAERVGPLKEALAHLRQDLLKEAAVLPDPTAVDTVLSLGFLNPENLGAFVSYLPVIDEAQGKMCELLLASRLGLKDIPTGAIERAIRSTEEAIQGIKVLAFDRQ